MGTASYIGRVGGLAVALGIGTAVATGYGMANAETGDEPTPDPPDTGQSIDTSSTPTSGPAEGTTTSTDSVVTQTEPTVNESQEFGEPATTSNTTIATGGVTVSAQTNTGSSAPDVEGIGTPGNGEPEPGTAPIDPVVVETPALTQTAPEPTPELRSGGTGEGNSGFSHTSGSTSTQPPSLSSGPPQAVTPGLAAGTADSLLDPAVAVQEPAKVALFADALSLASSGTPSYALEGATRSTQAPLAPAPPQDLLTAVVGVVSNVFNWVFNALAGNAPAAPAQPPLIWGLLAFARREFENFFSALAGRSNTPAMLSAPTSLSTFALLAEPIPTPLSPFGKTQVSPSTEFKGWVTGPYAYPNPSNPFEQDPLLANTASRFTVGGTDLGIMWDNGIVDNPATPFKEQNQVLIAVGDTFANSGMQGDWRANTIFRSSDVNLADGMQIPDGEWKNGNMFGGAPLGPEGYPTRARQVIFPEGLPAGITLIPTAGISVPAPGSKYGAIQYVSFMSVTQWGAPGSWTTNYSAIAWSDDNGETFHVAPQTVRYNQFWTGNQNFQQSAFVRPGDGYVYTYGTPNGRKGAAYLARVPEKEILNLSQYEYYNKGSAGGWFGWGATPAGWHKNNPGAATPVFGVDQGACGVANPGNQVSEMSVQYNPKLKKYVVLYGDQFNNIVMRTSDTPQGSWSSAKVLMPQQNGGIYAPMMHPWSPWLQGTGNDMYWNLSHWSSYNIALMKTDMTKV